MKQEKVFNKLFLFSLLCICVLAFISNYACISETPRDAQTAEAEVEEIPFDDTAGEQSLTRNCYFIFDGSGSMGDNCAGQKKIDGAKEALRRFMSKVPDDVNLGLYVFDGRGDREVVALGSGNRVEFMQAIEDIRDGGGTPLAEAIRTGTDQLIAQYKKQLGYGAYGMIIVSDGEASGLERAARETKSFGVIIMHTIALCMERGHPLKEYSHAYYEADDYEALEKALVEAVAEAEVFEPTEFVEKK
ncbi:hypothetical protein AYK26_00675 [Euryarchaeota archaeon SM23-78]|nr:MAG: hypothetical protein AYK26_00675 [Euryarchaeota archaeon SM23-78]